MSILLGGTVGSLPAPATTSVTTALGAVGESLGSAARMWYEKDCGSGGFVRLILQPDRLPMKKICLLLSITIFGWLGWWLGAYVNMMTAYGLSFVGSLVGVFVGCRVNRQYLDC